MEEKSIEVHMHEERVIKPDPEFSKKAHIKSMAEYETLYKKSVEDPDGFWAEQAEMLDHKKIGITNNSPFNASGSTISVNSWSGLDGDGGVKEGE